MRKHTKRRHYATGPGWNPIAHAMAGAAITPTAALDKLRTVELSALEQFKAGAPSVQDWRALCDMVNLCETMAKDGIGPEALEACARAEGALLAGHHRHNEHGRIGRAAGEYEALRDVWEYHDLQRQSVARSVYELAIQKTMNRIRSAAPGVKVLV